MKDFQLGHLCYHAGAWTFRTSARLVCSLCREDGIHLAYQPSQERQLQEIFQPSSNQVHPLTPQEALDNHGRQIHPDILTIVNEFLSQRFYNRNTTVKILQQEIVNEFMKRNVDFEPGRLVTEHHLDLEAVYTQAGWSVKYDGPGYNESYSAYYEFRLTK